MGLFSKLLEVWGHFWVWVFVVLKYNNKIHTYLFNTKKKNGAAYATPILITCKNIKIEDSNIPTKLNNSYYSI